MGGGVGVAILMVCKEVAFVLFYHRCSVDEA